MLTYNLKKSELYGRNKQVIKKVDCHLNKHWDELQRVDHSTTLNECRRRYCDSCQSQVFNLDGLSAEQIEGICMADTSLCIHATLPHSAIKVTNEEWGSPSCPDRSNGLKVIHTARHITAMNDAVDKGFNLLIKPVKKNSDIGSKVIVSRDKHGHVIIGTDYRCISSLKESIFWENPYTTPHPFAAYLIPSDLSLNEKVYLSDLIEDIRGGRWNQGDSWRLKSCEATWTGEDFEIDPNELEVIEIMG